MNLKYNQFKFAIEIDSWKKESKNAQDTNPYRKKYIFGDNPAMTPTEHYIKVAIIAFATLWSWYGKWVRKESLMYPADT